MSLFLIEPRDPLIVRDGRPFGPEPGARARSLAFPFPSTVAGAIRTQAGMTATGFDTNQTATVLQLKFRGPLLVELGKNEQIRTWLPPAPADVVLLKEGGYCQLQPLDTQSLGVRSNLPDPLALVGFTESHRKKRASQSPHYWKWAFFEQWLYTPQDHPAIDATSIGYGGLIPEFRTHVSIDPTTQTGKDGALFGTQGLEFTHTSNDPKYPYQVIRQAKQLAIAVDVQGYNLPQKTIAPMGGERRLMYWSSPASTLPSCPFDVQNQIVSQGYCRLILLTPAYFENGYLPTWLTEQYNVKATVKAIALPRYQVVSGWDFAYQNPQTGQWGRPKPTRRLAPAGTVFWLELKGIETDLKQWVSQIWMNNVSDDSTESNSHRDQHRRDGFGLAVLGTWPGKFAPINY